MSYLLHLVVMVEIYSMLTLSLNVLVGYTGLVALSHAAFYGIGAYVTALSMIKLGIPFVGAVGLAVLASGLLSLSIAVPSLRLRGDYFILATMGFQIIVFVVLYNWIPVTRGPYGIPGIPRPSFGPWIADGLGDMVLLGAMGLALVWGVVWGIDRSPFGLALRTVREDEIAARSLGYNTPHLKTWAFVLASALAAIPGALFAVYMRYIDPTSFTLMEAVFILSALLVGGVGNVRGPMVGAAILVLVPEGLRFLGFPDAVAANMRQILYGLMLIWVVLFRPRGVAGEYSLG